MIQFLTSWNGHEFGSTASLGGAEAGLIAARIARAWTPGIEPFTDRVAKLRYDADGALVGVVTADPVTGVESIASLGGGGASAWSSLSDKATANLPVDNSPLSTALGLKAPSISPTLTTPTLNGALAGTATLPAGYTMLAAPADGDSSLKIAPTSFVANGLALKSNKVTQSTVSASRDLTAADVGKCLECSTNSAPIVLSVPDSLMSAIDAVFARRNGSNTLTFAPKGGSSVVINDPNSVTAGNHGVIGILWETGNTYTLIA